MTYLIEDINSFLLKKFPANMACSWDRTGLLAGNPKSEVNKIAIALDPTVSAVRQAKKIGANLLLTHHPSYIEGLDNFLPADSVAQQNGALVYEAIKNDVALMNFHTALDVSNQGASIMPHMLDLIEGPIFVPIDDMPRAFSKRGFGRICFVKPDSSLSEDEVNTQLSQILKGNPTTSISLKQLAIKAKEAFKRTPRVWGNLDHKMRIIATTSGSAKGKDFIEACINGHIDCLVCGEIGYHDALALKDAGVCIIELGHDASELPFCELFNRVLLEFGFPKDKITILNQDDNWQVI